LKAALTSARSQLAANDPQGALSSVIEAVRLLGVPEEAFPALKEARRHTELLQQGQATFQISVEDLVSTLSQVSICAQQSVGDILSHGLISLCALAVDCLFKFTHVILRTQT
jgi:hypothetical protein